MDWVPKNWCFWTVVLEKTLESPLDSKEIQPVNPKGNQFWIFIGRTNVEAETPILWPPWCEELTHWIKPWCWERLKVGGEGDDRGWDGWMASPTWWTWVWASSGSWWWTGKPGVLQSMGLPRVGHDWATELNWTEQMMRDARLNELQAGMKIGGRNINNLRYVDDTTLMEESKEELKNLLMRVKEESEGASLRLHLQKKKLRSWHLAPLLHGK